MHEKSEYTVRKTGDNYGLYFKGKCVEVFASKRTAEKWKALSEAERRTRVNTKAL